MSAPPSKTIRSLTGRWKLNHQLSDDMDPFLALQGLSWLARRAAPMVTITLSVKEYSENGCPCMRTDQTATLGWTLPSEERCLDWQWRERDDSVYGILRTRSRLVKSSEMSSGDEFFQQDYDDDEHLEVVVVSDKRGWESVQIWGFEQVGGQRYETIRTVVTKGKKVEKMKLVYDWLGE